MDWTQARTHWTALTPQILTRWPDLSETDVLAADGNRDTLATLIADAVPTTKDDANVQIAEWLEGAEPTDAVMDESRDDARISASARAIPAGEVALDDDGAFGDENTAEPPVGRDR